MPITQRGSTTSNSTANSTSLSCTKPSGVVSGDVLLALVTSNDGTITATGWTRIAHSDGGNPNTFDSTWLYKVAGGSEGSSYTFNSSGSASPIVISITAWTGVDTSASPIGGSLMVGSGASTEPKSVSGCTNTPLALPIYSRAARVASDSSPGHPLTYSASGVTELDDNGQFSGSTVSYSHGIYVGTEATGNPPSLNITGTGSINEADNVVASLTLKTLITNVSVNMPTPPGATAAAYDAVVLTGISADAVTATSTSAAYDVKLGVQGILDPTARAYDATVSLASHPTAEVAQAVANAGINGVHYGAPPSRTYTPGAESRGYTPASESRLYLVENRKGSDGG